MSVQVQLFWAILRYCDSYIFSSIIWLVLILIPGGILLSKFYVKLNDNFGLISFKKVTLIIWTEDGGLWSLKKIKTLFIRIGGELEWRKRSIGCGADRPPGRYPAYTHTHTHMWCRSGDFWAMTLQKEIGCFVVVVVFLL